jgi:transposase
MAIIGVDVSKDALDLAQVDAPGTRASVWRVANTPEAITALVEQVRGVAPTLVAVEATGAYHVPLVSALAAADLPVALVNPAQIKAYRQVQQGRNKTDRADARLIADFARSQGERLHRYVAPPPAQQALRQLVVYREGLVKERTRLIGQLEAATWSGATVAAGFIRDDLERIRGRLGEVDREIETTLAELPEAAVLLAMTGVGIRVAAAVLAYLPASVWGRAKAAAAYAGVHPRQEASGRSSQSHLSKTGTSRLRRYLYLAALVAIRHDPTLKAWYQQRLDRGMAKQAAVCAVMHKLLRQMMGRIKAARAEASASAPLLAA